MVPAATEILLEARLPKAQWALVGNEHPDPNFETGIINIASCFAIDLLSFARQSPALRYATEALARAAAAACEAKDVPAGPTVGRRP